MGEMSDMNGSFSVHASVCIRGLELDKDLSLEPNGGLPFPTVGQTLLRSGSLLLARLRPKRAGAPIARAKALARQGTGPRGSRSPLARPD